LIRRSLLFAVVIFLLGGCATLDESQCKTINWRDLGARDAYEGQDRSRIESHRTACADFGIQPDRSAYDVGFDEGLRRLCIAQRGYSFATEGRAYRNTCPPELESLFQQGYRLGLDARLEANRVATLQSQIRSAEDLFRRTQDANERARLRLQIQTFDDQMRNAQFRLRRLEDEAVRLDYR